MKIMDKLSNRIKTKRKILGLKQKDVAKLMDVTSQAISSWEREVTNPSGELLLKLANVLKVNEGWLLYGDTFKNDKIKDCGEKVTFLRYYQSVNASAGHGCLNENETYSEYPVPKSVVDKQFDKDKLFCIECRGDSMEPVLKSGSILAVNPCQTRIDDGGLYVVKLGSELRVKILSLSNEGITLKSFNKQYLDETVKQGDVRFSVEGKVFWFSSSLND
ncbi:putative phage repressor (plasmid) [Shewanella baltica BA175]|nr:putative phage repressor [Shewanella baltica BA175]